ncbi:MAG: hypothetical protein K9K66_01530 [Desulfarculaceae bacterium]|nr:hypothetical protein [Desulfarculaceae bacterium]MCF8072395.1 hypothetical protein [Desulfarculaceae bacterium]MCF8100316.1 hypothetical protein [Desulfarculaceae bacterium]MCF8117917.1 hypothetical protein [Desulfarculaceae bacterium]
MHRFARITKFCFPILLVLLLASPAASQVAVTGQIGTLGVQGQITAKLNKYLDARLSLGAMPQWGFSADVSDINYDFDMSIYSLGGFVDYHPLAGGFRVSAGVIFNNHDINSSANPAKDKTYDIGGTTYPGAALGTLDAKADFNKVAPYVGIGYNGVWRAYERLSFTCELGVMFWGSPNVSLSSNMSGVVPGLKQSLEREESDLESQLDFLQYYPVAAVGVSWAF